MRMNRVLALGASLVLAVAACTGGATPAPSTGGGSSPSTAASPSAAQSASPSASASAGASGSATASGSAANCSVASASAAPSPSGGASGAKAPVRIGSDNFYESVLMAEIYAQVLEKNGYTVQRKFKLGARQARQPALESGQIDMVPEYVGSGLGNYEKGCVTGDGPTNQARLAAVLANKGGGISVLAISPGQDQNAFVVRKETATSMNLAKMSDLAAVQDQLKWGLPADCDTNPLCSGALQQYGINYPPKQRQALDACDVPMATALQGKAIDLAELCSTQPAILQFGFVALQDDKQTQPADNIAPLVRNDYLAKVDAASFASLLDAASAKMTTEQLLKLGVDVAVNHKDVATVAKQWLSDNGL
jgi:osmoprotectant transport system substrate-binding protein